MVLHTVKTSPCVRPGYLDYLLVSTEPPDVKVYVIPKSEWTALYLRAGKRFDTIAPLAPYPLGFFGMCDWKCNGTVYRWWLKRLAEIQSRCPQVFEEAGVSHGNC